MAHFVGTGTIATGIVRKETRNGVLATFRMASGPSGRGRIWIDVEAWATSPAPSTNTEPKGWVLTGVQKEDRMGNASVPC